MYSHHDGRGSKVFVGLIFLALGVILLMGNLNLFEIRPLLSEWWPVLFIVLGIKSLIVYRGARAWVGGLFWMGMGGLFLSSTLGYLDISIPSLIWPLVVIWFGVFTLLGCADTRHPDTGRGGES
jgi:hypothetical protein